ncbi:hypothetical protein DW261_14215 [Fusobacterium varium]|uniref:glycosyltransferase n=1 Tax=Fusobacterium varium TaxID=856 RepID=UPI000E5432FA|nr:glycosyltransferase [Fusobacterium varium]RHG32315.1 hypothetical protein DW261_14215 [Fusobacterium varium]
MIYLAGKQVFKHNRIEFLEEMLKKRKIDYYYIKDKGFFSFFKKLIYILKSDIIYVLPCNWPVFIVIFSKMFRKKIISEFYYSIYDAAVNDWKRHNPNSIKGKILKMFDYIILNFSTEVIFLNNTEAKRYMKMILNKKRNYKVIPLAVEERKKVKLKFFKKEREIFNLCWWGGYIPLHGLDKMIKAMKLLEDEKINFYILGAMEEQERSKKYENIILKLNLKNCFIDNSLSFSNGKLEEFLVENCDLALGGFGESKKINEVILNKTLDIFSMKGICLTAYSKAMNEYFEEGKSAFYCNKTPEEIAKKILEILHKDFKEVSDIGENSYKIYKKYFTKDYYQKEIYKVIKNIYEI